MRLSFRHAALSLCVAAAAMSPSAAQHGPSDSLPLDDFFDATSFDSRTADAALARIAARWADGHTAMILDLARFTRPSDVPASQDLSGVMPQIDPQGAPAMPRYPGAHFGTLGSARLDPTTAVRRRLLAFLERQTGQRFQDDLDRWRRWLWERPYAPTPEYAAFKAALYARIDPAIARFFRPAARAVVRLDEIEWAGVGANDVAPLFYPTATQSVESRDLRDDDEVVGVSVGGEARAYGRRLLARHVLIHDRLGGVEILIVQDPAGRIAAAYDLTPSGGPLLRFGTSGLVYRSIVLMFDERTASLWSPLTGEVVLGEGVGREPLRRLPLMVTTWRQWRALHPSTTRIAVLRGAETAEERHARSPILVYPLPAPPRLKGSSIVAASGGLAIPVGGLSRDAVREFTAQGRRLAVITWRDRAFAVYEAGGARLVRRRSQHVEDDRGRLWRIGDDALTFEDDPGERLPRVATPVTSWAVWYAHLPAAHLAQ